MFRCFMVPSYFNDKPLSLESFAFNPDVDMTELQPTSIEKQLKSGISAVASSQTTQTLLKTSKQSGASTRKLSVCKFLSIVYEFG